MKRVIFVDICWYFTLYSFFKIECNLVKYGVTWYSQCIERINIDHKRTHQYIPYWQSRAQTTEGSVYIDNI